MESQRTDREYLRYLTLESTLDIASLGNNGTAVQCAGPGRFLNKNLGFTPPVPGPPYSSVQVEPTKIPGQPHNRMPKPRHSASVPPLSFIPPPAHLPYLLHSKVPHCPPFKVGTPRFAPCRGPNTGTRTTIQDK